MEYTREGRHYAVRFGFDRERRAMIMAGAQAARARTASRTAAGGPLSALLVAVDQVFQRGELL